MCSIVIACASLGCVATEPELEPLPGTALTTLGGDPVVASGGMAAGAMSWDGRLVMTVAADPSADGCPAQLLVKAVQPRGFDAGTGPAPAFASSYSTTFALAPPTGTTSLIDRSRPGGDEIQACRLSGAHIALAADPATDVRAENPYPCAPVDGLGFVPRARGTYECYDALIVVANVPDGDTSRKFLMVGQGKVVTDAFEDAASGRRRKDAPSIVDARLTTGLRPMVHVEADGTRTPFASWEPTATADGRLVGMSGGYTYNFSQPFDLDGWSRLTPLADAHKENATYCARGDSTRCRSFQDMYPFSREPPRDPTGAPCDARSCFGAYLWFSQDGAEVFFNQTPVPTVAGRTTKASLKVLGQRTNFTEKLIDGSLNQVRYDLIGHTTSPGFTGGMWAPYREEAPAKFPLERRVDVYPVFSRSRYGDVDFSDFTDGDYSLYLHLNELVARSIAVEDPCIKAIGGIVPNVNVSSDLTPDTSGEFRTGRLAGGAVFPLDRWKLNGGAPRCFTAIETSAPDGQPAEQADGHIGRYVTFPASGQVVVGETPDPTLDRDLSLAFAAWTLQFALRPEPALATREAITRIATKAGSWSVYLTPIGRLAVALEVDGNPELGSDDVTVTYAPLVRVAGTAASTPVLCEAGAWCHVAIRSTRGELLILVNGVIQATFAQVTAEEVAVRTSSSPLILGPNAQLATTRYADDYTYLYSLDEVALSRVARTVAELRRAARVLQAATPGFVPEAELPATLPASLEPRWPFTRAHLRVPEELRSILAAGTFDQVARLGEILFNDARITQQAQPIACATCHRSATTRIDDRVSAQDGLSRGVLWTSTEPVFTDRNTPTVLNRAFSTHQLADGRARSLVAQVLLPIVNPKEMSGDLDAVIAFVRADLSERNYTARFQSVFGAEPNAADLARALAAYVLTEQRPSSLGQRVLFGATTAQDEALPEIANVRAGAALFRGKANCTSCHFGPNLTDEEFHTTGIGDGSDAGRGAITRRVADRGAFKTPTLVGTAQSAPYFHDGTFATLRDVLEFYNDAPTASAPGSDPLLRPLGLTDVELDRLEAFLRALDVASP